MSDRDLDAVRRFTEAFGARDVDGIMALMTDDVVFEATDPPPDGRRFEGAAAVRGVWAALFHDTPSPAFETEEYFVGDDGRAVVRWRFSWEGGSVRGVDVLRLRDGKVCEKLSYVKG